MYKGLIYQGKDYSYRFEISDDGKLRNIITGTIYKTVINRGTGYEGVYVSLGSKNNCKLFKIHRCVAETFISNPNNYPVINHKDGNKSNNHISNLEWCTIKENNIHAYKTGLRKVLKGEDIYCSKLKQKEVDFIRENYKEGDSIFGCRKLAKMFNVSHTTISDIINNKIWK